ncbi:hypothetical protein GCM10012275_29630 [Longimycelium tulufanense]|uniref:Cell wall anchor protein n=1 Tax=Longimycelium tulufanense TaxID=907463 RepID=A0A8J3FVA6_9PSEU|nr:DUF6319 family protein [Longimycelium tulufanense]GGM56559.1 hypothetical protein GCM10012275_29630 [Longimycelium tulufanense]
MPRPRPLSEEELEQLRAELSTGREPSVWFTSAAVGVEAGRSGRVVALGDPADGDYIQVRPTGSKDVLAFSATEVTTVKPPRKKKAAEPPTRKRASAPVAAASTPAASVAAPVRPTHTAKAEPATERPVAAPASTPPAQPPAKPKRGGRKPVDPPAVVVTLSSTAEGEWLVEVVTGKKRTVRGLSVSPGAVAQAARALHPDVSAAIETVLDAARERQRTRVEQLQAELEAARRMLSELSE